MQEVVLEWFKHTNSWYESLSGPFSGPPSLSQERILGVTANPLLQTAGMFRIIIKIK